MVLSAKLLDGGKSDKLQQGLAHPRGRAYTRAGAQSSGLNAVCDVHPVEGE
jgi:hypothetical protein